MTPADEQRLQAFEAVLAEMQGSLEEATEQLAQLRDQGKAKTATYQQLSARKLALKSALAAFERHDLLDAPDAD